MTTITADCVVTLNYEVTSPEGEALDAGETPLVYLHGGYGDIFPVIEEALEGKSVGDTVMVKLQPDQAYGEYDSELVTIESLANLPQPLEVGMQIEVEDEAEDGDTHFLRVTDIAGGVAVLDANHPLAGLALVFTATVMALRPATAAELEAGQAG